MNQINRPNQINRISPINVTDLLQYWNVIRRQKIIIIGVFLLVFIAMIIKTLTMVPIYRATTQIMVEQANPNMVSPQEFYAHDCTNADFYQTQCKILESRTLAQDVSRRIKVFYPDYRTQKIGSVFTLTLKRWINAPKKWLKSGSPPDAKSSDQYPVGRQITGEGEEENAALNNIVLSGLTVTPVKNTQLINISVDSEDPNLAAMLANTLVDSYMDWNLNLRVKGQKEASRFLDEQVKAAKARQEASELALQQYREKYGVAALEAPRDGNRGQDLSSQNLSTVNQQLLEATNRRVEAEIQYKQALNVLNDSTKVESIPAVVNNSIIVGIKQQEVALQREKMEKAQKFGVKHPVMVALNQEIEKLRLQKMQEIRNVVDSLKSRYEIALQQEDTLKRAVSVSQSKTINRDKIAIQYQVLQQEVDSNRALYDTLLKRMKETSVNEEVRTVNVHVLDRAEVPTDYYEPNLRKSMLIAVALGLLLGIGIAFLIEYLDKTVKSPEELEQLLNIPHLGSVPHFEISADNPTEQLVALHNSLSSASESYRGIRTGIVFSTAGHKPRVILITSANVGEGKTITSANVATVMAQTGAKVLLVDADMRRPQQHRMFGENNEKGLTNILVGDEDWRSVVKDTPVQNLNYICSGPIPPNPAELVGSDSMKQAIDKFLEHYDNVIIDSPPINVVTDPLVLSKMVDAVVIVLRSGKVTKDQIKQAWKQLQNVKANVLGVVFNHVDVQKVTYYDSYQYKYYYAEDGSRSKRHRTKQAPG
ncbi:MAG: polysaccharide biosynthesis tyrosine autokinase [Syntrophaceae bacterium]|nr:polysaccharide biosynthesis tyrosine autokinase [Syntrophaceae bacterium]